MKKLIPLSAIIAMLASAGPARATIYYTFDETVFDSVTHGQAVDTFSDLTVAAPLPSPTRAVGPYTYQVGAAVGPYGWGTAANPSITSFVSVPLVFSNFTGGADAIGGYFYPSYTPDTFAVGSLRLTATDASGTDAFTVIVGSNTQFFGVYSDTGILGLSVTTTSAYFDAYPVVDNLVLARTGAAPVVNAPEPAAWTLALTGLLCLVGVRRRPTDRT